MQSFQLCQNTFYDPALINIQNKQPKSAQNYFLTRHNTSYLKTERSDAKRMGVLWLDMLSCNMSELSTGKGIAAWWSNSDRSIRTACRPAFDPPALTGCISNTPEIMLLTSTAVVTVIVKPKFHYANFHQNFPTGKVVDIDHENRKLKQWQIMKSWSFGKSCWHKSWKLQMQTISTCRDVCNKHQTFATKSTDFVANTNHESPRHKSWKSVTWLCRGLSWFVSVTFPAGKFR